MRKALDRPNGGIDLMLLDGFHVKAKFFQQRANMLDPCKQEVVREEQLVWISTPGEVTSIASLDKQNFLATKVSGKFLQKCLKIRNVGENID